MLSLVLDDDAEAASCLSWLLGLISLLQLGTLLSKMKDANINSTHIKTDPRVSHLFDARMTNLVYFMYCIPDQLKRLVLNSPICSALPKIINPWN